MDLQVDHKAAPWEEIRESVVNLLTNNLDAKLAITLVLFLGTATGAL